MPTRKYVIAAVGFAVTLAGQVAAGLGEVKSDDTDPLAADVVPEENLKDLRGGMDMNGLVGYFAIDRVVEVDGEVVAKMQIVVTNLNKLASGGMPTISVSGPVAELVQVMSGGTLAANLAAAQPKEAAALTTAAPAAAVAPASPDESSVVHSGGSASTAPATVAATGASAPGQATGAAPSLQANVQVVPQASSGPPAPSSAATQQSSGTNANAGITRVVPIGSTGQYVVISNLPNASSLATVVQNEVRGTMIQTQTTITASLNSLTALNGLALASAIQQQVSLSLHH